VCASRRHGGNSGCRRLNRSARAATISMKVLLAGEWWDEVTVHDTQRPAQGEFRGGQ